MGIKNDLKGKCVTCNHCKQQSTGSLYCNAYGVYVKINDPDGRCYSYSENVFQNDRDIEQIKRNYGRYFILSRISKIYEENGKTFNSEYLKTFKKMFDEILPTMPNGNNIINAYNNIGPIIANKITIEYQNKALKDNLLQDLDNIFMPLINECYLLFIQNKYEEAINKYRQILLCFMSRYYSVPTFVLNQKADSIYKSNDVQDIMTKQLIVKKICK